LALPLLLALFPIPDITVEEHIQLELDLGIDFSQLEQPEINHVEAQCEQVSHASDLNNHYTWNDGHYQLEIPGLMEMLCPKKSVRLPAVFAGLLANREVLGCYGRALYLWNWLRMRDNEYNNGSGFYDFSVLEAAEVFGKSERTILRWLKKGKQRDLFTQVLLLPCGKRRVFYTSVVKVANRSSAGLVELSAIYLGNSADMRGIEGECVQAVTQLFQNRSRYVVEKAYKRKVKKTFACGHRRPIAKVREADFVLPTLKTKVSTDTSEEGSENSLISWVGKTPSGTSLQRQYMDHRFTYMGQHYTHYGASQQIIGESLGLHRVTVSRLLSNKHRSQHCLKPLVRRQVVQEHPEYAPLVLAKEQLPENIFVAHKKVWQLLTNVYEEKLTLLRLSSVRKRFAKLEETYAHKLLAFSESAQKLISQVNSQLLPPSLLNNILTTSLVNIVSSKCALLALAASAAESLLSAFCLDF